MRLKTAGAVILLLGLAPMIWAQYYYGKNKIQREIESTYTYETEHFSIYTEEGGEPLAKFAAEVLEEAYVKHSKDFGFDIPVKIPVIIYKSQPDFAATNIILEPIEESVGGFSETFKNRVVVPFSGSYEDLHHVLYHELVHIFEFELYYSLSISNLFAIVPGFTPPLWVMEGLAEFSSNHGGRDSDAFMRDLLLSNNLIPLKDFAYYGGYIVYRQGESVFLYIEERYGREKVFELIHAIKIRRGMEAAFEKVFGMNIEEFGKDWMNWLRKRYLPDIVRLDNSKAEVRFLTDHVKEYSYYNGSVTLSPSGAKIAYATSKDDYITVNVISAFDGTHLKKILRAGQLATFERLPLLRQTMTWSPDEAHLAVIGFSHAKPALLWINYESARIERSYQLKVDDAYSPAISKNGKKLVYIGIKNGMSDLYSLDLSTGKVQQLTFDLYEQKDPSFNGNAVLYVSDKPLKDSVWKIGSYAIYELLPSGRTKRISPFFSSIAQPYRIGEDIYFIGKDYQLCKYSPKDSATSELTQWFEKVEDFSPASSGKAAFLIYRDAGWDVAVLNGTLKDFANGALALDTSESKSGYLYNIEEVTSEDFEPYKPAFSTDYIYGSGAYSSISGANGSFNMAISDMLGDHRFYINANLHGDLLYSNMSVSYWYLKHRIDYAVGGFQLASFYLRREADSSLTFQKRAKRGLSSLVSFPISKFFRIETGLDAMAVSDHLYFDCAYDNFGRIYYRKGNDTSYTNPLFQANAALVFDNALWKYSTPMRGVRMRLGAYTSFLSPDKYQTVYGDFRGYLAITRRASIALRTFGQASFGSQRERSHLGGGFDVRGYSATASASSYGSKLGFANLELRVPFIDRLSIAFPLPITIGDIRGVLFTDAGVAWDETPPVLWDSTGLVDLKASYGAGLRMLLGYWMLKLDFARPYVKEHPSDKGWDLWKVHFRVGADF